VASSKREKELARQRAERQAARRAAAAQRKKQRQAIVASVVAVLLVVTALTAAALTLRGEDDAPDVAAPAATAEPAASADPAASAEPSEPAASRAPGDPGCEYIPTGEPATREVTLPRTERVELTMVYDVTIETNRGEIVFEMDSSEAPCTANNFRTLAHFGYFENTPCHRLTTEGISVLQCGSPDGSGTGNPGYTFADENLEGATYERGTVAMANSGPDTNGSQFFLVYEDSSLPPLYTPFGTITSGLDVLEKIAAAGSDNSNGVGDGKPNLPVEILSVQARPRPE
jgi:peptidyl-prolyl cis-trans isomerase B (cyclophilin B)